MSAIAASMKRHPGGSGAWIGLFSGRRIDPFDPHPDDIDIEDIGHALANTARFTGHTKAFYSVAQHSVLVTEQVIKSSGFATMTDAKQALLHDASEAYLCDVARPVKRHPVMAPYREAEARLQAAIQARFGLKPEMPAAVKTADNRMLVTEARQLLGGDLVDWHLERFGEPYEMAIEPWSPSKAKLQFLLNATWMGLR